MFCLDYGNYGGGRNWPILKLADQWLGAKGNWPAIARELTRPRNSREAERPSRNIYYYLFYWLIDFIIYQRERKREREASFCVDSQPRSQNWQKEEMREGERKEGRKKVGVEQAKRLRKEAVPPPPPTHSLTHHIRTTCICHLLLLFKLLLPSYDDTPFLKSSRVRCRFVILSLSSPFLSFLSSFQFYYHIL